MGWHRDGLLLACPLTPLPPPYGAIARWVPGHTRGAGCLLRGARLGYMTSFCVAALHHCSRPWPAPPPLLQVQPHMQHEHLPPHQATGLSCATWGLHLRALGLPCACPHCVCVWHGGRGPVCSLEKVHMRYVSTCAWAQAAGPGSDEEGLAGPKPPSRQTPPGACASVGSKPLQWG